MIRYIKKETDRRETETERYCKLGELKGTEQKTMEKRRTERKERRRERKKKERMRWKQKGRESKAKGK